MADEGHDHSAPNDKQHIAQHVGEMFRQLVQLRGLPVFLIYQEEDGEFGTLSAMIESDTIQVLGEALEGIKGAFEGTAQWELPRA